MIGSGVSAMRQKLLTICFLFSNKMKHVWRKFLQWIQVDHNPLPWLDEVQWLNAYCRRKGKKVWIMRITLAETIYHCWNWRNVVCIDNHIDSNSIVNTIIETIIHRSWHRKRYREYTAHLMM